MNISKINIDLISDPQVREVIEIFRQVSLMLGIDYYMIGARAKDLWLKVIDIDPPKFTLDIDFAVHIQTLEDYAKSKKSTY
jgi:predicted nucleotidyltransferase